MQIAPSRRKYRTIISDNSKRCPKMILLDKIRSLLLFLVVVGTHVASEDTNGLRCRCCTATNRTNFISTLDICEPCDLTNISHTPSQRCEAGCSSTGLILCDDKYGDSSCVTNCGATTVATTEATGSTTVGTTLSTDATTTGPATVITGAATNTTTGPPPITTAENHTNHTTTQPDPCQIHLGVCNQGTCRGNRTSQTFQCLCPAYWGGSHCEITPCSRNSCQNGASCLDLDSPPWFTCRCSGGYGGETCEVS